MNNISEQLLQAIDIVADEKISKLRYDKTIQAKIYRIDDLDTGEYKVRYNGNIFSAFASDINKTYKVDESVYVIVPEGDFSQKKLITSSANKQSLTSNQLATLKNSIFEASPNFNELYDGAYDPNQMYGVVAGAPPEDQLSYNYIYKGPDEIDSGGFHGLFQQYANTYELIRIQASFLVQFYDLHSIGNYGLEVEFYTKDGSSVSYRLDLSSFNGDPYKFSVYSLQYIIIKAQKSYLTGLKSIKLFEENFEYDRLMKDGKVTDEQNTTIPNIFVKNISIQFVEQKDLSQTTYYLMIAAPRGVAFTSSITELELMGRIVYQGKDIMDTSVKCTWYERDLEVMIGHEAYDKNAGFGWRKIEEGPTSIKRYRNQIGHDQRYKLVAIYKDVVLTAETRLYNQTNLYDYAIAQTTKEADIRLQLVNNYNNEVLLGKWYMSYPDGSYMSILDGQKQNSISITDYLKYSSVIFYCTVYNQAGQILGTLEYTIMSSESEDDVSITYVGEDNFRYDANGDITIESAELERTLQVNLAWKEGYGTSYNVEWVMRDEDGLEVKLPNSKLSAYKPDNSMMENLWVDNYNILHYNIKQKYRVNFNNNTVIVKIITIGGETYLFNKEILFLKDGDQGTNGTTYITAVRPCLADGSKLSGLRPLRYNNGWQGDMQLRCYVYKDGEMINNSPGYKITYRWAGINVYINDQAKLNTSNSQVTVRGIPTISASLSSKDLEFYVKVQVTIEDNINKTRDIDIYASYPIDVAVGNFDYTDIDISDIPSYIKYTSSGLNPSFYSKNIRFIYKEKEYNQNISSLNENILKIKDRDGKRYLDPATSFIFEDIKNNDSSNIAVLNLNIPDSSYRLIHPIIMYLDNYGNEAINGWDGTALEVDENGQYVFAPQIGAGKKDSANRFSGVIMGQDSTQNQIGLYGYSHGTNTFGLMEDGTAFFGAKSGGGQIVINGKTATISGGDGGNNEKGMTIILADLGNNVSKSTEAIKLGGGVFRITYDGTIYAAKGYIGCDKNGRGGWEISSNRLYSNSEDTYVALDSSSYDNEPMAIWAGSTSSSYAPFSVSKKGALKATSATISGTISGSTITGTNISGSTITGTTISGNTITGGSISGTTITGTTITGNTISGGTITGTTISGGTISGSSITGGSITGGNISGGSISGSSITGGSISIGSNFGVNTSGVLTCSSANITGAINATSLTAYQVTIAGNANLTGNYGYLGQVGGNADGNPTYNIGISSSYGASIILNSAQNIRLSPSYAGYTYIDRGYLRNLQYVDFSNATVVGLDTKAKFA